ncbi:MAG: HD domain-containing protein [Fusobacteria bacterium]|nr:HD domain-containing protein [Fusobacteriota bacterium]
MKHKILVVIENFDELGYISDNLKSDFQVFTANTLEETVEMIRKFQPNILLVDSSLPKISGAELCRQIKKSSLKSATPLIILSTDRSKESEALALESGAIDYISKPLNYRILKLRVDNIIQSSLEQKNLKDMIQIRTHELEKIQNNMINTILMISEYRDPETSAHIVRIKHYVLAVAQKMRENSKFSNMLTSKFIKTIYDVSPLHDIGKIIISDSVLLKPTEYTVEERHVMEKHTLYGAYIVELIEKGIEDNFYLEIAHNIILHHHEKWDGTGYPEGLKGANIPLCARIMAVADTFDALITKKSYREASSFEDAFAEIKSLSGRKLDPDVVDAFLAVKEIIVKIVQKYSEVLETSNLLDIRLSGD